MKTVTVVIPSYKPDEDLRMLLDQLREQTFPISKILIINTENALWLDFLKKEKMTSDSFAAKYPLVAVSHISREEFDHAATRQKAILSADTDYVVLMTMDAIPKDAHLIEELIRPFEEQKDIAVSYARQLPKEDAGEVERFTRSFNYPAESRRKTKEDLGELGIKTYFCSDVCAAYDRQKFLELGGFVERAIFNEDMIYAAGAIKAGYGIYYAAKALVYHSHNYTGIQQLKRNFDMGVSQAQHPEVFADVPAESEGISMVKKTVFHLLRKGKLFEVIRLVYLSGCKYIGYRLGKSYKKLSERQIMRCTSNPAYWKK